MTKTTTGTSSEELSDDQLDQVVGGQSTGIRALATLSAAMANAANEDALAGAEKAEKLVQGQTVKP
jgi:bacteriocin-like protein